MEYRLSDSLTLARLKRLIGFLNNVLVDRFNTELDALLSDMPDRVLRRTKGVDNVRLNNLYVCKQLCILIAGKHVFGTGNASKYSVSGLFKGQRD